MSLSVLNKDVIFTMCAPFAVLTVLSAHSHASYVLLCLLGTFFVCFCIFYVFIYCRPFSFVYCNHFVFSIVVGIPSFSLTEICLSLMPPLCK